MRVNHHSNRTKFETKAQRFFTLDRRTSTEVVRRRWWSANPVPAGPWNGTESRPSSWSTCSGTVRPCGTRVRCTTVTSAWRTSRWSRSAPSSSVPRRRSPRRYARCECSSAGKTSRWNGPGNPAAPLTTPSGSATNCCVSWTISRGTRRSRSTTVRPAPVQPRGRPGPCPAVRSHQTWVLLLSISMLYYYNYGIRYVF